MSRQPPQTCIFFVDDSNIWIEAQKYAASGNTRNKRLPKLTNKDRDPRVRIDLGALVNTMCRGRSPGHSFLYGSRPPPNDSVWKAAKNFNFETKIYDRARGKEKQVDTSMATDMSVQATKLSTVAEFDKKVKQQKDNTTFVIISGDLDMLPAVNVVLGNNIRLELWAWDSSISREYLQKKHDLFKVYFLDEIFSQVFFTNFFSTRKGGEILPSQTVVLSESEPKDEDNLEDWVCMPLMQLGRLFYIMRPEGGRALFVEFPDTPNLDFMIHKIRELFEDKKTLKVESYVVYAGDSQKMGPVLVATKNLFAPLRNDNDEDVEPTILEEQEEGIKTNRHEVQTSISAKPDGGYNGEEQHSNDPDDSGGWTAVSRSNPGRRHSRRSRQEQPCPNGIRCRERGECGYRHSEEEKRLFRDNPHRQFSKWKTAKCTRVTPHRTDKCSYAHGEKDAWCQKCCGNGHFTEACKIGIYN